jgi:hypothetical protein
LSISDPLNESTVTNKMKQKEKRKPFVCFFMNVNWILVGYDTPKLIYPKSVCIVKRTNHIR